MEFARERRERGLDVREAAREAARIRFGPILMTSFAFILGSLPLMPAFYVAVERLAEWRGRGRPTPPSGSP